MATWISDASANRHIKTYVNGFVDVSGNFTIKQNGSTVFNPNDTTNFIPGVFEFTDNASDEINTTTIKSVQFKYDPGQQLATIEDNSYGLIFAITPRSKYETNPSRYSEIQPSSSWPLNAGLSRYQYQDETYGLRMFTNNKARLRIDYSSWATIISQSDYSLTRTARWWGFVAGNANALQTANLDNFSIFSFGQILVAGGFYGVRSFTQSDKRIKTNIQTINDDLALTKLRLLNPCTYKYKDKVEVGHENSVEGFIAQEIKEVLPYAVSTIDKFIPNIISVGSYEIDGSGNKIITIPDYDTANLELDASGNFFPELRIYHETNDRAEAVITKIVSSNSLQIETTEKLPNDIFVYGQKVNNFHTIQKENIFTIATAALQELDRQLQAQKLKKVTLETQIADLRARVNLLKGQ